MGKGTLLISSGDSHSVYILVSLGRYLPLQRNLPRVFVDLSGVLQRLVSIAMKFISNGVYIGFDCFFYAVGRAVFQHLCPNALELISDGLYIRLDCFFYAV